MIKNHRTAYLGLLIIALISSSVLALMNNTKGVFMRMQDTNATNFLPSKLAYAQQPKAGEEGENVQSNNRNDTMMAATQHHLYGCSQYEYVGFHCDPIRNDFESSAFLASYTKVASATREPDYVQAEFGKGVQVSMHKLESLRANIIDAYDTSTFSVSVSFKPDTSDEGFASSYSTLVSYKNGIYGGDIHDAGWQIQTVPTEDKSVSKVRFTVFNSTGSRFSPPDVTLPADRFSEVLGSFDGRNVRLFVDGQMKGATLINGTYSGNVSRSNFLTVGGDAYCDCELVSGVIDEVRYYNNSGYHGISGNASANEDGLIGYWKFDGDLRDYSQYKNDMFYNTMIASMAFAPDGRLFYNEKNSGNIRIMVNGTIFDEPFASIRGVHADWDQGLLGLAIDSKFAENHFVYVYYNYKDEGNAGQIYGRVVRFTDSNNRGEAETVLIDKIPADGIGFHTGGALGFNPVDEELYVSVGDGTDPNRAQDVSSLYGKVLRVNRDGSIPSDNPFPGSPVYDYGHRNSYGIAFDFNGHGIYTEPGSTFYDELNISRKGGNYGWPTYQPADTPPELSSDNNTIKPLRTYWHAITPTQAIYYNGDKYPELKGKFIFGSLVGSIYAVKLNDDGTQLVQEWRLKTNNYPSLEVVNVAASPGGDIYFGAYDIFRLDGIDPTSKTTVMYPVEISVANAGVSGIAYSRQTESISADLNNRHDLSSVSMQIPNALISNIKYQEQGNQTTTKLLRSVKIEPRGDYTQVNLQVSEEAPTDIRLTIGKSLKIEAMQSTSSSASPTSDWRTSLLRPSGCLIATAAFGSELTPQVQYLRNFRQKFILSTESGSAFMSAFNAIYYSFSPQIADYERGNPWLQQIVKSGLYPLFGILNISALAHASAGGGEIGSLVAGAAASLLIGIVYLSPVTAIGWRLQKRFFSAEKVSLFVAVASLGAVTLGVLIDNLLILAVSTSLLVLSLVCASAVGAVIIVQKIVDLLRLYKDADRKERRSL